MGPATFGLAVPYWWSPRCYDICRDDVRGGWKCLWIAFRFERAHVFNGAGFTMRVSCGFGSMFKSLG